MESRKVKITIWYRFKPVSKEEYTTTFIIDECYLLHFLPSLIREDIERVEVEEYNK